jgi:hypothetical protein
MTDIDTFCKNEIIKEIELIYSVDPLYVYVHNNLLNNNLINNISLKNKLYSKFKNFNDIPYDTLLLFIITLYNNPEYIYKKNMHLFIINHNNYINELFETLKNNNTNINNDDTTVILNLIEYLNNNKITEFINDSYSNQNIKNILLSFIDNYINVIINENLNIDICDLSINIFNNYYLYDLIKNNMFIELTDKYGNNFNKLNDFCNDFADKNIDCLTNINNKEFIDKINIKINLLKPCILQNKIKYYKIKDINYKLYYYNQIYNFDLQQEILNYFSTNYLDNMPFYFKKIENIEKIINNIIFIEILNFEPEVDIS